MIRMSHFTTFFQKDFGVFVRQLRGATRLQYLGLTVNNTVKYGQLVSHGYNCKPLNENTTH
jgi:hypothetical protein